MASVKNLGFGKAAQDLEMRERSTGDIGDFVVTSRLVNLRCLVIRTVGNTTLVLRAINLRGLHKFINNWIKRIVASGHSTTKLRQ